MKGHELSAFAVGAAVTARKENLSAFLFFSPHSEKHCTRDCAFFPSNTELFVLHGYHICEYIRS